MDSKPVPTYQDLEVHTEWVHEAADDTLILYLSGFTRDKLKVQLTTTGKLRISGERPLGDNKFGRFFKEFPIPSNCEENKIRANFINGMLHVKHPKRIAPAEKQEEEEEAKPSAQVPKADQKHAPQPPASPQKQKNGPEQAVVQEAPPKATAEKETGEKKDGVAQRADDVSSKAPDKAKEMKDEKSAANGSDEKAMEEEEKSSDQEEKATTSEEKAATSKGKHEKLGDSVHCAAKKENAEPKVLDGANKYYQLGINYKQILDGLLTELKNPGKTMNTVLAVLLVVVLAVYIRNAIKSPSLKNDKN